MKKIILIPAITLAAVSLAACSGGSSSAAAKTQQAQEEAPAEDEEPLLPAEVPMPENSMFDPDSVGVLKYQQNPGAVTRITLATEIAPSECTPEAIEDFYFNYFYPTYEACGSDDYIIEAVLIFDDLSGAPYSSNIGVFMNKLGSIQTYQYLDYNSERKEFKRTSLYTPDVKSYDVDFENKKLVFQWDYSDLSEEEKAEYIIE